MQNILKIGAGLLFCLLIFSPCAIGAAEVDNQIYASLLKKFVNGNRVNYNGIKKEETLLDDYLSILSSTDVKSLTQNERFAFYINAYNAFTIKLVLTKYPGINSIKEIGGFFSNPWKQKFIPLRGKTISLDHIEHRVLRPDFKDPRVHFAINCASRSCPPLRTEPYEGARLETQLNEQAGSFINNKKNTFMKGNTLFVSKIFQWFEDDFSGNPLPFIKRYADGELKKNLDSAVGKIKIQYLDYSWSLNQ